MLLYSCGFQRNLLLLSSHLLLKWEIHFSFNSLDDYLLFLLFLSLADVVIWCDVEVMWNQTAPDLSVPCCDIFCSFKEAIKSLVWRSTETFYCIRMALMAVWWNGMCVCVWASACLLFTSVVRVFLAGVQRRKVWMFMQTFSLLKTLPAARGIGYSQGKYVWLTLDT